MVHIFSGALTPKQFHGIMDDQADGIGQGQAGLRQFRIVAKDAIMIVIAVEKRHQFMQVVRYEMRFQGGRTLGQHLRVFTQQLDDVQFLRQRQTCRGQKAPSSSGLRYAMPRSLATSKMLQRRA